MIVASLIATMGFQATLSSPGGFWQQDIAHVNSFGTNSVTIFAGNSISADKHLHQYKRFMIGNTVGFISSLSVILLLISGLPYKRKVFMWILMVIMWIAISAMAYTYSMSVKSSILASQNELKGLFSRLQLELIFGWIVLMAFFNLMHTIRLISHGIRRWGSKLRVFM
ncbi:hypothetical protein LIER_41928 [Lithospermum erythrorhizon]|uniref:PGG domain-containing protein n=1 Tax=Lithospermum erythrorhizon TaxID=34254 RepID=A0AAV3RGJ0_LITER